MTFPIDLVLGGVTIPSHVIFDILSFYLAFRYYLFVKQKSLDPLSENNRWYVLAGAAFGALVGSRLLGALERPDMFFSPENILFYIQFKTVVGGIIGGILGVELVKKSIGEKTSSGDLFTFPLILGMMLGRIGCFLTGVSDGTVGNESSVPWAFDQGDGLPRHPTSLYEIVFLAIMWVILKKVQKKQLPNGALFRLFIISYLLFRFFIEFIKPVNPLFINLSAIQIASASFALYYTYSLFTTYRGKLSDKVVL